MDRRTAIAPGHDPLSSNSVSTTPVMSTGSVSPLTSSSAPQIVAAVRPSPSATIAPPSVTTSSSRTPTRSPTPTQSSTRRGKAVERSQLTDSAIGTQTPPLECLAKFKALMIDRQWDSLLAVTAEFINDDCEVRSRAEYEEASMGHASTPRRFMPHQQREIILARVFAMIELRRPKDGLAEIDRLGKLDDPIHYYETYEGLYPSYLKGSFLPYSILVLKAELPAMAGNVTATMDLLFNLQAEVERRLSELDSKQSATTSSMSNSSEGDPLLSFDLPADAWRARMVRVTLSIATQLMQQKEYVRALQVLTEVIDKPYAGDAELLSALGRCHLEICDLASAIPVFARAEKAADQSHGPLLKMNSALVQMAESKYQDAVETFQVVIDWDREEAGGTEREAHVHRMRVSAVNNQAICHLYGGSMRKAIVALEQFLQSDPTRNMDRTLLFNLCTMYDLESDQSSAKKKALQGLVRTHAPPGFDMSVLKLPS